MFPSAFACRGEDIVPLLSTGPGLWSSVVVVQGHPVIVGSVVCQCVLGQGTGPHSAPNVVWNVGTLQDSHWHRCMDVCIMCVVSFFFLKFNVIVLWVLQVNMGHIEDRSDSAFLMILPWWGQNQDTVAQHTLESHNNPFRLIWLNEILLKLWAVGRTKSDIERSQLNSELITYCHS